MGQAKYNEDIMADFMPLISPVIDVVNKGIVSCGEAMTKAQKLYNQIWLFKQELSNIQILGLSFFFRQFPTYVSSKVHFDA